jgi:hypothetical protein
MFRQNTPTSVDSDCKTILFVRTNAESEDVVDPDFETATFVALPDVVGRSRESGDPYRNR